MFPYIVLAPALNVPVIVVKMLSTYLLDFLISFHKKISIILTSRFWIVGRQSWRNIRINLVTILFFFTSLSLLFLSSHLFHFSLALFFFIFSLICLTFSTFFFGFFLLLIANFFC